MSDAPVRQSVSDPLIDEVRSIRREISERYGNDVDRLCDHLRELERQHNEWTMVEEPAEGSGPRSESTNR